jgi:hypothetical protein
VHLPRGRRDGKGIDLSAEPAGQPRRLVIAAAAGDAFELGVELLDQPEAPLHLHLVEDARDQVGCGDGLPTLAWGQTSLQLGGDGHGAVEKPCRHLHLMAPDRVTHLSEDLVQVLTEGAQTPAGDPQLQVGAVGLASAAVVAPQELQQLGCGRAPPDKLKLGGDGQAD